VGTEAGQVLEKWVIRGAGGEKNKKEKNAESSSNADLKGGELQKSDAINA